MANTPNYNLYKPNRNDNLPVDTTLAANFDIIDTELKNISNQVGNGNNKVDWANVLNKPITISGYGINNAYTKLETDNEINNAFSLVNSRIGTLEGLQTVNKANIVNAINEVKASIGSGGGGGAASSPSTYFVELSKFGIVQGIPTKPWTNANYTLANSNVVGINAALEYAYTNNFNHVVFPRGEYAICYPNPITPKANTTIDFNFSTFKVLYSSTVRSPLDASSNPIYAFPTGGGSSILVTTPDTHIRNLILIGDRIERSFSIAEERLQENTIGIKLGTGSDRSTVKYCDISYYMADAIYLSYSPYTHMDIGVMENGDISNTGTLVPGTETNIIRTVSYIPLTSGIKSFSMIGLGYNPETSIPNKTYNIFFFNSSNTFISSKKGARTRDRVIIPKGATKIKLSWVGNGTLDDGTNPPNNPPYWAQLLDKGIAENTLLEYNIIHRNHRGGIFLGHNNCTIRKNYFHDTGVDGDFDIDGIPTFPDGTRYGINTEDNIGQNCTIESNVFDNVRIAIALRGEYNNVTQNEFRNCQYGIILYLQKHIVVDKNFFYKSGFACFEYDNLDRDWTINTNTFVDSFINFTGVGGSVTSVSNNSFKGGFFASTPRVFKFVNNLFDAATITLSDNLTMIDSCVFINKSSIKAIGINLIDCITGCYFTSGSYARGQNGGTFIIKNSFFNEGRFEFSSGNMTFKFINCEINNITTPLADNPDWLDLGTVPHSLEIINSKVSIGTNLIRSNEWGDLTIDGSTITFLTATPLSSVLHTGAGDFNGIVKMINSIFATSSSTAAHTLSGAKEYVNDNNTFTNVTFSTGTNVPKTVSKASVTPNSGKYVLGQLIVNTNPVIGGTIGWICTTPGTFSNGSWVASTSYPVGRLVDVGNRVYLCTIAGTSGTIAPSHSSGSATNGTATFQYISQKPVLTPYGTISGTLDTTPPNEVTNLAASNITTTSLILNWTASTSPDIASYDIYNGANLIANVSGTTYSVTGLTIGTNYTFYVKGRDMTDNVSTGASLNVSTASSVDSTPPNNVTNLTVSNLADKTLTLNWTASTSGDIASYDIYKEATFLANVTGTTYNVTGLTASTSYTFWVKAKDLTGNIASGTSVNATTTAPVATLVLRDTFNRADASTLGVADTGGQTWTTNGTRGISSNQAYVDVDYGGVGINPGALTDYSVETVFSTIAASGEPSLIFKRVDGTTAVWVSALATSYVVKGFNMDGGMTTYQTHTLTPVNGDLIKVNVISGVATVYVNGNLIMTWTISSYYSGGTEVGLRSLSVNNRFDEFKVYSY